MKLSIIVPAHNEEERIGRMLSEYLPFFVDLYAEDVEFIVVVNGSYDDTEQVVRGIAKDYPALNCIVDNRKIGKGGALMKGFAEGKGDLIGFVDADGATPPSAFNNLVENIDDADVIIASRWCKGAKVSPRQPWARLLTSRVFNVMTRWMFGLKLSDTQCGAKLMRRDTLMRVMPELGLTQWAFDVDLLFHFRGVKGKIREIPTVWQDIEGSKISALAKTSFDMFLALTRLRLLHSPFKWIVTLYDRLISPLIRSEDDKEDRLIRHGFIVMTASQISNVCNLAFQMVMVRLITSTGDYSVLMAMLSAFGIVNIPLGAMSRAMTHFSAHFIQEGERHRVVPMLVSCMKDISIAGMIFMIMVYVFRVDVAAFFKLESATPALIMSVALVLAFFSTSLSGVLQGAQAFFWTSAMSIMMAVTRVIFAAIFVLLGYSALGALTGQALSVLSALLLGVVGVVSVVGNGSRWKAQRIKAFYLYVAPAMLALAGYAVLMTADVIIVRHYFEAAEADLFAKGAMVARMVIFFPMPIALVMFPKVVTAGEVTRDTRRIFMKGVALVAFLVLSIAVFCSIYPVFVARVIAGSSDAALTPIIRGMVWALSPISIVYLIVNFELAQRRLAITIPMVLSALLYIVGVVIWHDSLRQIIIVLSAVGITALFLSAFSIPCHWLRTRPKITAS